MSKNDNIIILYEKKHSKKVHWIFIAIVLFLVIFMPIYGTTLRYDISNTFRFIFSSIGELSLTCGGALTALSVVFSVASRKFYLKSFIFGVVLLWIGAFMTDAQFSLFGIVFGGNSPPQGYH